MEPCVPITAVKVLNCTFLLVSIYSAFGKKIEIGSMQCVILGHGIKCIIRTKRAATSRSLQVTPSGVRLGLELRPGDGRIKRAKRDRALSGRY